MSARTEDSEDLADPPDVGCRAALESSAYVSVCRESLSKKKRAIKSSDPPDVGCRAVL